MLVPLPPDPLEWHPPPSFRERVLAAVGTPALVGALIFLAAIASVILLVLAQPHAPGEDRVAASVASGSSDGWTEDGDDVAEGQDVAVGGAGAPVLVHVVGEVERPGVVELPAGSRVADAIVSAGGATEDAALEGVNLARIVSDGEQIVVPDPRAAAVPAVASGASGPGAPPLNINSADVTALESLPRVGPALAQRIVDWRASHGRFTGVDDLLEVSGIGPKTLDGFRDRVTV